MVKKAYSEQLSLLRTLVEENESLVNAKDAVRMRNSDEIVVF